MSAGPELPSGTVTFLFTDIEGSTRLLKRLREGYAPMVGGHRELLRAALAAHGGVVVDAQNPLNVDFVSRRVGNYQHNPQWGVLLDQLWVK